MTTDHEIWHAALLMIEHYGADAALAAGNCSEVWQRILAAIEYLQRERPAEGEAVN
jgi:hypothetical protein